MQKFIASDRDHDPVLPLRELLKLIAARSLSISQAVLSAVVLAREQRRVDILFTVLWVNFIFFCDIRLQRTPDNLSEAGGTPVSLGLVFFFVVISYIFIEILGRPEVAEN